MSDPNPSTQEVSQTPRILLVDDEPGLRTAVQAYLEDEGFQVTTAVDGEEGWEKAQKMSPDVIISDVMMPRCDGYGLLKKIREDERLGGTPVIFLTAKGMTADRTQGYQAGVDDYMPKPFDPNGGWSRQKAQEWINELKNEPRLEWIEQPLPSKDIEGLFSLANQIPIALDESLVEFPYLRKTWKSWQIRRPALDGDPRLLLKEIEQEDSQTVISTAFETGIGRRWVNHLAARQVKGGNPCAPGLAPGWCPKGPLFNNNPKLVWEAV